MPSHRAPRLPGIHLSVLAIALVVVTLVGSVIIPARMTWGIRGQLREINDVVEPARAQRHVLQSGLALEAASLQAYLLTRDAGMLERYRAAILVNERRLALLERRARPLGPRVVAHVEDLRQRIGYWRELNARLISADGASTSDVALHAAHEALFDQGDAAPVFALEAARRRERIRTLEERSLNVNAALVIVALAATLSVVTLTLRERTVAADARQRAVAEVALREEKARLLDEARASRQQLERAMQSRSRLMRGFSHDVKNPLGAADGYAALLTLGVHGELTAAQRHSVEGIHRCIQSALGLIDDLHQLGRAETGKIVVTKDWVDVATLLRSSGEDYAATAEAKGLSFAVDLGDEVPLVETDRVRVREIVGNLLSNAIKYTPKGSVTLRARTADQLAPRDAPPAVLIEVIDTGLGIPADKREHIFEEFSRLSTDQAGAGLGLAISQLLASALDARISLESTPGIGSTFTLALPLPVAPPAPTTLADESLAVHYG